MSDLTNYGEGQFADWSFQGETMDAAPANLYVSLHTADPGDDGSANEVDAGDYSRAETTAGEDWDQSGSQPTVTENAVEIAFGVAESTWGEVTHFAIWDSDEGGNAIWASALDGSKTVEENDEIRFREGDLTASVN